MVSLGESRKLTQLYIFQSIHATLVSLGESLYLCSRENGNIDAICQYREYSSRLTHPDSPTKQQCYKKTYSYENIGDSPRLTS